MEIKEGQETEEQPSYPEHQHSSVSGRPYLLGKRKGLAWLKNKKGKINQVFILKSKQHHVHKR